MGWEEKGWDGMRRDEKGWAETGWDGKRRDRMG